MRFVNMEYLTDEVDIGYNHKTRDPTNTKAGSLHFYSIASKTIRTNSNLKRAALNVIESLF